MGEDKERVAILHVSDTHFGYKAIEHVWSWLPQWETHDFELCAHLQAAAHRIRRDLGLGADEPLNVVVSGDLTSKGADDEFLVAHSFVRSAWRCHRSGPGSAIGLSSSDPALVPGNHDHWGGTVRQPPGAFNADVVGRHFRKTPFTKSWQSVEGGLRVELYALDTNSGLGGTNFLAHGAIADRELEQLQDLLAENKERYGSTDCVRALVMHHSLAYEGSAMMANAKALAGPDRERLLAIAVEHGIRVFLTGHTHSFTARQVGITDHRLPIWELGSPTTLQAPRKAKRQGFWLHEAQRRNSEITWGAWQFAWNGKSFERGDKVELSLDLPRS